MKRFIGICYLGSAALGLVAGLAGNRTMFAFAFGVIIVSTIGLMIDP